MIEWKIHQYFETVSTNIDAIRGQHGEVFCAEWQSAGRGRLDHRWLAPPGSSLLMSLVLSVAEIPPLQIATLPLAVGLAAVQAIDAVLNAKNANSVEKSTFPCQLKWPNDVLIDGRKVAGILCERHDERVIVGIGVNVNPREFPPEIAGRAAVLADYRHFDERRQAIDEVRAALLEKIAEIYENWRKNGFGAIYPQIKAIDFLRGRDISVLQTDNDTQPVSGICDGIALDGSLSVGGIAIYAGEAHVLGIKAKQA